MKAKVLITGGKGQLAKAFSEIFSLKNWDFVSLSKKDLDISDYVNVREIVSEYKPDIIINCAAYNNVDGAEDEWRKAILVNGFGVRNLAEVANKYNSLLVHFSTDYVFDGLKGKPYTIADIPNPINLYGKSKYLGEKYAFMAKKFFLIRVSWVFGDGEKNFPYKLIQWARENQKLRIVSDQISSPSYTQDIAEIVYELLKTEAYGLYHLSNKGFCSRFEWAEFILNEIGWRGKLTPVSIDEFKLKAYRPKFSALETYPIEEILEKRVPDWKNATKRFLNRIKIGGFS